MKLAQLIEIGPREADAADEGRRVGPISVVIGEDKQNSDDPFKFGSETYSVGTGGN